jgi:hypothetical protein
VHKEVFPKEPSDITRQEEGSFPFYRRRCRHTFMKKGFVMDDTWVVPWNAYLMYKYNAHINVEICGSAIRG